MIRKTLVMAAAVALFAAPQVHANVITYYLQDVNLDPWTGTGGTPTGGLMDLTGASYYASVMIDDHDGSGNVDFTVTINTSVLAGTSNSGIQDFAFNDNNGKLADANPSVEITNLPSGWDGAVDHDQRNADGYGTFDAEADNLGTDRQWPSLTFSITGIPGDTIDDYAGPSSSGSHAWFAVHITGIDTGIGVTDPNASTYDYCDPVDNVNCFLLQSAWFGGGDEFGGPPTSVVPEPLSAALVGGALLGLVAIRRRNG